MNIRLALKCSTCQQGIVLRLGVGAQVSQNIAFQCPNCKQKIAFKHSSEVGNFDIENLTFVDKEEEDFIAINMHPELIYPKKYINEKTMLPSVYILEDLYKHAEKEGILFLSGKRKKSSFGFDTVALFDELGGDSNLLSDWKIIYKSYSLFQSDMFDLMSHELKNYSNFDNVYIGKSLLFSILFDFLSRFLAPNLKLYHSIKKNFNQAKKKEDEFIKLKKYYDEELKNIYWTDYFDIFNEYFKSFSEFNRLLINTKIALHPEENTECILCPVNFDEVKMFYGNAYEYITSHLNLFAGCNNIISNRTYDQFSTMTLNQYNRLNKDSKLNPLRSNVSFQLFVDNLDSTLRNASHHKWFYIDKHDPAYLLYRSGGTGAINKLSYIDYLYKSNLLMNKLAIMSMIEIKFFITSKK